MLVDRDHGALRIQILLGLASKCTDLFWPSSNSGQKKQFCKGASADLRLPVRDPIDLLALINEVDTNAHTTPSVGRHVDRLIVVAIASARRADYRRRILPLP